MRISDVMTRDVVTLTPSHSVKHAAQLMLERRISSIPVVEDGKLVGMLTQGDMLRRIELGLPEAAVKGWNKANSPDGVARDFVRSHSWNVGDVMSKPVATATEDMTLADAATLLSTRGVKRLPVVRDGQLVGILSRADLLHAIATATSEPIAVGDNAMAISIRARLRDAGAVLTGQPTVTVVNRIVHLWGTVASEAERDVVRVAAESDPDIAGVEDHMSVLRAAPPG